MADSAENQASSSKPSDIRQRLPYTDTAVEVIQGKLKVDMKQSTPTDISILRLPYLS